LSRVPAGGMLFDPLRAHKKSSALEGFLFSTKNVTPALAYGASVARRALSPMKQSPRCGGLLRARNKYAPAMT